MTMFDHVAQILEAVQSPPIEKTTNTIETLRCLMPSKINTAKTSSNGSTRALFPKPNRDQSISDWANQYTPINS